jgi:hypothetical protein
VDAASRFELFYWSLTHTKDRDTASVRRTGERPCLHQERSVLVVVAEESQVDRFGHGPVAGIVGMHVIPAVKRRQQA